MKVAKLTPFEAKKAIEVLEKELDKGFPAIHIAIVIAALRDAEIIQFYGRGDR